MSQIRRGGPPLRSNPFLPSVPQFTCRGGCLSGFVPSFPAPTQSAPSAKSVVSLVPPLAKKCNPFVRFCGHLRAFALFCGPSFFQIASRATAPPTPQKTLETSCSHNRDS